MKVVELKDQTRSDFLCPGLLHKPVSMRNLYRRKLVSILTCIHAMPPPYKLREALLRGDKHIVKRPRGSRMPAE